MNAHQTYNYWMNHLAPDDQMRAELAAIQGDEAQITDRFYQEIAFGTAGLRGICGAGTNRMNVLTVGRATKGLADYICSHDSSLKNLGNSSGAEKSPRERGVAIAYDCRHNSREFAALAARILAGAGIHVFLFPSLRPTPELSYTVRKLGCISGINMTASHNPKEYNGYKVYWEDGAQISGEVSNGISARIKALDLFEDFGALTMEEALTRGLVTMLGQETDKDYLNYVLSLRQREDDELDLSVPVVYTPLNGAGSIPFREMVKRRHFTGFHIVTEQKDPDPDFTSVPYPNPEEPAAFELAQKLGREVDAEVLIATDPDSDRMAIEIADGKGGYQFLNGNQTGAMLIAYLAQSRLDKEKKLSGRPAMIKSIVTGDFGRTICDAYGIRVFETLTGFKNICGKIPKILKEGYSYFFGYEESIGCAPGVEVRDKDGVSAGMLVIEMAAWYRNRGISLLDALQNLYRTYGFFAEEQISLVLKGKDGADKIDALMNAIRRFGRGKPADSGIAGIIDYLNGYQDIPPQNALKLIMNDGSWFAVRPSGTEPKIKFYYYSVSDPASGSMNESKQKIEKMKKLAETITSGIVLS